MNEKSPMNAATYAIEAEVEGVHWWFKGRRRLFRDILGRLNLARNSPLLDIGTGTGSNLRLMKELGYTNVIGVDASPEAINFCRQKGWEHVRQGDICNLPFEDGQFNIIMATDVIEHVENDGQALSEINRTLAPGGSAVITVPAFRFLWGLQDEVGKHKRRYTLEEIERKVLQAGLTIKVGFYFNAILLGPIWLARRIIRLARLNVANENEINNAFINLILAGIFSLDVWLAARTRLPFGVSIIVLASKPL